MKNESQLGVEMRKTISKIENRVRRIVIHWRCRTARDIKYKVPVWFFFFSYKKFQIESTWTWYSCATLGPGTSVHSRFPARKKREAEGAQTRSFGAFTSKRKTTARASFVLPDFLLDFSFIHQQSTT